MTAKFPIGSRPRLTTDTTALAAVGLPSSFAGDEVEIVSYNYDYGVYRVQHSSVKIPLAADASILVEG